MLGPDDTGDWSVDMTGPAPRVLVNGNEIPGVIAVATSCELNEAAFISLTCKTRTIKSVDLDCNDA